MKNICRIITLSLLLTSWTGCALQHPLRTSFDPCHRVTIEKPPIWTASAAWTPEEDRVLLIGPNRHSLLIYDLQGELQQEVDLDALADFEYSTPIRLQETEDGYLIGDKSQILWLDKSFRKRRLWHPFEHLKGAGIAAGTLNDFTVVGRTVYAFADFVWDDGEAAEPAPAVPSAPKKVDTDPYAHEVPNSDTPPGGSWFRGFAKIDLDEPELVSLHQFDIEDEELNDYYLYGKRPYVTDLGKRAYILRYTDPPRLFRSTRKELKPFFAAKAEDDYKIGSLLTWEGRLFLRGSRRLETESKVVQEPTKPVMITKHPMAELRTMHRARPDVTIQSLLIELDPKTGKTLGTFRLPTTQKAMKLVPGHSYWAMIEESSRFNIHPESKLHLTLLPSSWLVRRNSNTEEVILACPTGY